MTCPDDTPAAPHLEPTPSRPLALRRLDGWPVYDDGAADWIRDLDLAERAGLERPRSIRAVVKKALADGLVNIASGEGDAQGALARLERTIATVGNGAAREVGEFYLNREAALHVVMRLRTPIAVQLQTAIVRVFILAEQGRLAPPAAPAPPPATPEARAELLFRIGAAMPHGADRDAALAGAAALLAPPSPGLQLAPRATGPGRLPPGRWFRPSDLAAELGTTAYAVGRAISTLGFRAPSQAQHRHRFLDRKANADGVVECSMWDEHVREAVRAHLADPQQAKRARRARVRAGAEEVLAALAALDEDAPASSRARRRKARPSPSSPDTAATSATTADATHAAEAK
jgi:hypothetical protein